jgi:hypothetical protein
MQCPRQSHAAGAPPTASIPRAPPELVEAMCGNPDDMALRAQLAQAVHDLEATTAAMRGLDVEWGFVAPLPPAAP